MARAAPPRILFFRARQGENQHPKTSLRANALGNHRGSAFYTPKLTTAIGALRRNVWARWRANRQDSAWRKPEGGMILSQHVRLQPRAHPMRLALRGKCQVTGPVAGNGNRR